MTQTRVSPDELDIRLMFRSFKTQEGTGIAIIGKEYYTNAAFDVDPAIGSTETYGFDEYAALYTYYRVVGYSYNVTITNSNGPGGADLMAYVLNTNVFPSGSRLDLYSTNPYCKSKLLPSVSPNTVTFRGRHKISQITGTPACETADSFRAVTTTIPSDLTYILIAGESLTGTSVKFSYDLKLYMDIRFYGRQYDLSLSAFSLRVSELMAAKERRSLEKKIKSNSQNSTGLVVASKS